jgi:hypothetical protein
MLDGMTATGFFQGVLGNSSCWFAAIVRLRIWELIMRMDGDPPSRQLYPISNHDDLHDQALFIPATRVFACEQDA